MQPNGPIAVAGFTASEHAVTIYTADGHPITLDATSYRTNDVLDDIIDKMAALRAKNLGGAPVVEINIADFSISKRIEENSGGAIRVILNEKDEPAEIRVGKFQIAEGVEKLGRHIELAARSTHSALALENFIRRFSKVQASRKHTAEELLGFVKQNDLPIAQDGRIIAFKILRKDAKVPHSFGEGYWFDKHTGAIPQRAGSLVMMPANAVDDSRRHACSTGFHVCSVEYWQGFWSPGDPITITLVDPADIIAVPRGEQAKMRACAYFVAASIEREHAIRIHAERAHAHIAEVQALVAQVAAGNHAPVLETVFQNASGEITVTPATNAETRPARKRIKKLNRASREPEVKARVIDTGALRNKLNDALEGKQRPRTEKIALAKQLIETRRLTVRAAAQQLRMSGSWLKKSLDAEGWKPTASEVDVHMQSTATAKLGVAQKLLEGGKSVREAARISGVARSTLQDHLKRTPSAPVAIAETTPPAANAMTRDERIAAATRLIDEEGWSVKRAAKLHKLSDSWLGKSLKKRT
ncbi:helix-turn-helix domain-containing protein [Bosea massiliensis]|uniref:Helix-turn-helix domain-containing protein n=1 Tax=Bosea massiliensis TaxID=151419 RepID=A0ABW0P7N7_9HYPH